jgi:hypothetical protein
MAKTILRTNLQRTLSFRAKLKKTGHIRKGFLKVEGPGCKTEETRGFICKSARLHWGVDLSHRIAIGRMGSKVVVRAVDRY